MKKVILVIIALAFIPSLSFAANFAKTKKTAAAETTADTQTQYILDESIIEAKTETQPLLELKTPEVTIETKPVSGVKTSAAKTEIKPISQVKAPQAKIEAKAPEKKPSPVKTPAFKEEKPSSAPAKADLRSFTGRIDSVALGDVATGIQPIIVAVDDNGERIPFVVKARTSIAAGGRTIKLNDIKKDSKVVIEFTVRPVEGFVAQSIKLQ